MRARQRREHMDQDHQPRPGRHRVRQQCNRIVTGGKSLSHDARPHDDGQQHGRAQGFGGNAADDCH